MASSIRGSADVQVDAAPEGVPSRRGRRSVWRRLLGNPLASTSLVVLVAMVLLALAGPLVATPPDRISLHERFAARRAGHWLGTDDLGRDVLSRLLSAGRVSLGVGIGSALIAVLLGASLGSAAGYYGGWIDFWVSRIVDVLLTFPILALAMAVSAFISLTPGAIVLLIGGLSWMPTARLVRAETLSLSHQEFVQAARAIGAAPHRILARHIVPNALGVLVISATLLVPRSILTEAALSFLGFGVRPPAATWGNMLLQAQPFIRDYPWLAVYPGVCIALTVCCFNFLGDGLREALDPRLKL